MKTMQVQLVRRKTKLLKKSLKNPFIILKMLGMAENHQVQRKEELEDLHCGCVTMYVGRDS